MRAARYDSAARRQSSLDEGEFAAAGIPRDQSLKLVHVERLPALRLPALRPLLDALLTPLMPLRLLHLEVSMPLAAAAVAGCEHHLSALTALSMVYRGEEPAGSLPAALQALAEQAPLLAELRVSGYLGGTFPAFLPHRTRLRELHLSCNGLAGLLPGPYLSGGGKHAPASVCLLLLPSVPVSAAAVISFCFLCGHS
ncbi:hypothetical protein ABPG75_011316 [Micractinium tetrahymenae]